MMEIEELLKKVKSGEVDINEAVLQLKQQPFIDLDYAKLDMHRRIRSGHNEVIYGSGKTAAQIHGIVNAMLENACQNILITRINKEKAAELSMANAVYYETPEILVVNPVNICENTDDFIAVVSAGTSDMKVCEEAAVTAETFGNHVKRVYDVGVAGLHRLLSQLDIIQSAKCVIVVAGMEGALASVVSGLVDKPVIAVPTSVGYGANFEGLAALLSMINSCANGVSIVNIDNGFGAGHLASIINKL